MSELRAANMVESSRVVDRKEAFWTWLRVALLSFGGPAAQIAVMHRIIIDEKKWLDERRFLNALNFCMLLPGPEAQQLATYIGWLLHGVRGGLVAGLLFILPGFLSILVLSCLYVAFENKPAFQMIFFGLKCAVLAVIFEAVQRVGRRVLKNRLLVGIAAGAFLLLSTRLLSFPLVVVVAALAGLLGHRFFPEAFQSLTSATGALCPAALNEQAVVIRLTEARPSLMRSLIVSLICLTLWFGPVLLVSQLTGKSSVLTQSSLFFSKAAVVTFGGAYSVLSYVDQQAVDQYHWLKKGEMADGLALAETTPGPLIMVVQFVGFLAAARHSTEMSPLLGGTCGAILTTWVTFVPCFYWIFLGAPYIERLREQRWLSAALTSVTAAVVGVIASLGWSMTVSTLFRESNLTPVFWGQMTWPELNSIRFDACIISALAVLLLLVLHRGLAVTLMLCLLAGLAIQGLTPIAF